jgi:hypothetical protein
MPKELRLLKTIAKIEAWNSFMNKVDCNWFSQMQSKRDPLYREYKKLIK